MSFTVEKTWTTKAGLTAVAMVVEYGGYKHHRCGYVGVPADSFLAGLHYDNKIVKVSVHGGLTYTRNNNTLTNYPIASKDWFFGFDCFHCDDSIIQPSKTDLEVYGTTLVAKDLDFVITECESLAEQLAKILRGDSHD